MVKNIYLSWVFNCKSFSSYLSLSQIRVYAVFFFFNIPKNRHHRIPYFSARKKKKRGGDKPASKNKKKGIKCCCINIRGVKKFTKCECVCVFFLYITFKFQENIRFFFKKRVVYKRCQEGHCCWYIIYKTRVYGVIYIAKSLILKLEILHALCII